MQTCLDCIPCLLRQAIDALRLATADEKSHIEILRRVLSALSRMDLSASPPRMAQQIHRMVRQDTATRDPYKSVKERLNRTALSLYPDLEARVARATDPLQTALRLAICGNVIDFGPYRTMDTERIQTAIAQALADPLHGDLAQLKQALQGARNILFLGDNAGEIVFDRLLLKQLGDRKIVYAVRGAPVLNDATIDDARSTQMTALVEVVTNGSDAPGTLLPDCSPDFRRRFERADLVVSKGQGNYETLSAVKRPICFLLKAKCPLIAAHLGCSLGSHVALAAHCR